MSIWGWLHEYVQFTIYSGVKALIILVPLFIVVAYYTYAERKVIGYMQSRKAIFSVIALPICTAPPDKDSLSLVSSAELNVAP